MPKETDIKMRKGTAAAWASANPVLSAGEPGFETDTKKLKLGNGSTACLLQNECSEGHQRLLVIFI